MRWRTRSFIVIDRDQTDGSDSESDPDETLLEKKPFKLVAVALANKMARIAFAILRHKTVYREIPA